MDDDGAHGDDSADGEASRVAHEDLGGVGVVPQKSDQCADKGTEEHHQFLRPWYVHDVEVGSILDVAAHIGQDAERHAYDGRVARTHSVHAVVEVGAVGDRRHDKDRHDDEEYPARRHAMLAAEAHHLGVVEVVVLDEGDGSFERLLRLLAVLDDDFLSVFLPKLHVQVRLHVGRGP